VALSRSVRRRHAILRWSSALRYSDRVRRQRGALLDAPKVEDFDWVVEETAKELSISREHIELIGLSGTGERFASMDDAAVPNPRLKNPHPQRWERVDIGPDDRTLRIEYVHGVVTDLHSLQVREDEYRVFVTVFLGWNPPEGHEKGVHCVCGDGHRGMDERRHAGASRSARGRRQRRPMTGEKTL
jgi:hypothetical protein